MTQDGSIRDTALTRAARLGPTDHACWFFRSQDEHREVVSAFVRRGVEHDARILYLADAIPIETVMSDLAAAGLRPDHLADRGQLLPRSLSEGYLADGAFDPARQVALYRTLAEEALGDGFTALWITGEGTWEIRGGVASPEDARRYEQVTEDFLAGTDHALALCQYDASVVSGHAEAWLRSVHNIEVSTDLRMLDRRTSTFGLTPTVTGLAVSGSIDLGTWATFRRALERAVERSSDDVVLEVGELTFIDGHGLGIIGKTARTLEPGRRLVLRGASSHLVRVAEIMGLQRLQTITIEGRRD